MPYKNITQDPTLPQGFNHNFRERFWSKVKKTESCWLWIGVVDNKGYGVINRGNNKRYFAHRASWLVNNGAIPDRHGVLHKCDNPPCVNPAHLFTGTQQDNMADCLSKKRFASGEKSYHAKLTWKIVREMREMFASGIKQCKIAIAFNCRQEHVRKIITHERWKE